MNKEDYFKYYIQGSDHYLIPKDVFDELFEEMSNWREEAKELKEKYLNAVADYETTMFEKEQLNSLVNSCQEEIRQLKKQLEDYKKLGFKYLQDKNNNLETQQKEFIEWLEAMSKMYENEYKDIDIAGHYNCVLAKYKEIIGVSDDKTN